MIFDLIMATAGAQPVVPVWTPAQLFQNGEIGYWLDSSDLSTLFQDSAGTVPVTASGQPIGLWKNKIAQPIFNLAQATAAARPLLNITSGKMAIRYDGVDDQLLVASSGTIANSGCTFALGQKKSADPSFGGQAALQHVGGATLTLQNQVGGSIFAQAMGATLQSSNAISLSAGNTIIAHARGSVSPLTIILNGTTTVAGSNPTGATVDSAVRIVSTVSNACDIAQAFFINRVLTAAERTQLANFISGKQ